MSVDNYFKTVAGNIYPFDSKSKESTSRAWELARAEKLARKPSVWRAFPAETSAPWYGADLVGLISAQGARERGIGPNDFHEVVASRAEVIAEVERAWADRRVS